jgi:Uri superfamily endonuclease
MNPIALPVAPGTYLLVLQAINPIRLQVGSLGEMEVRPGYYLYVGSAFGPGGLRARVSRHFGGQGKPHWHIDHLRQVAQPVEAWCAPGMRREHAWAQALAGAACRMPLARFGASDCRCPAHLFYLPQQPDPVWLMDHLSLPEAYSAGQVRVFSAPD